jgi:hypothetical protein
LGGHWRGTACFRALDDGEEWGDTCPSRAFARAGGLQLVWGRKGELAKFLRAGETTITPQEERSSPINGRWHIAKFQGTATIKIAEGRFLSGEKTESIGTAVRIGSNKATSSGGGIHIAGWVMTAPRCRREMSKAIFFYEEGKQQCLEVGLH